MNMTNQVLTPHSTLFACLGSWVSKYLLLFLILQALFNIYFIIKVESLYVQDKKYKKSALSQSQHFDNYD